MCSVRHAAALALAAASVPAVHGDPMPQGALSTPIRAVVAAAQLPQPIAPARVQTGAIAGRILDKDGMPFAGASVEALAAQFQDGRESLVPMARAQSNERGEFRLEGLAAGRYLVSAFDPTPHHIDTTESGRYPPTYFPGVVQAVEADRVTVAPGAPSPRVEFRLRMVRPSRVSGVIRTEDGRQLVSGAVLMTPEESSVLSAVPPEDVTILPDGTFMFRNVPPGRYRIRARGETEAQGVALFATFALNVDARDVSHVTLILGPGGSLEGTMMMDPDATSRPASYAGLRVRAPFADGSSFGDAPTGDVMPDGSFRIRGLMSGAHYVTIEGLPAPWVLKSVRHRGQELVDVPFDIGKGERLRNVRVTITNLATEVHGTVRSGQGTAVPGAIVIVLPLSPQFWTRTSRRFRVSRTDAEGGFLVRGLPPGEYRVFASLDLDEAEAYRPDLLRHIAASGIPLSLAERETRALDLPLGNTAPSGR
jgi:hypothetical protein